MLESAAKEQGEARFRYVQHGGGAKRYGALIGGHAQVSAFSVAEYQQFREGGLRALAYCGNEPHPMRGCDRQPSHKDLMWSVATCSSGGPPRDPSRAN